ncbi:unnamed protein product [Rangifer tarandus platyrhynchus]|uniref:Uncharacterized protein n=1 Tax=Rangifer tarandus platyrhynchus TaxID=3082113 RepID=A0ABN8XMD9_RANTA|nr:unnamed protein product [Rangifer tarandus platyrhynchus]
MHLYSQRRLVYKPDLGNCIAASNGKRINVYVSERLCAFLPEKQQSSLTHAAERKTLTLLQTRNDQQTYEIGLTGSILYYSSGGHTPSSTCCCCCCCLCCPCCCRSCGCPITFLHGPFRSRRGLLQQQMPRLPVLLLLLGTEGGGKKPCCGRRLRLPCCCVSYSPPLAAAAAARGSSRWGSCVRPSSSSSSSGETHIVAPCFDG